MADTTGSFAAVVISRHPERFVIPNDRDFEPIAADPRGRVSFLIVATVSDDTHTGNGIDLAGRVRQADPTAWELVKDYDGVQLYRFVPTPGSRGNDARPNQLPSGGAA